MPSEHAPQAFVVQSPVWGRETAAGRLPKERGLWRARVPARRVVAGSVPRMRLPGTAALQKDST
jgi:hypothetical protein